MPDPVPAVADGVIDTGRIPPSGVVASAPEIETAGLRASAEKLRQKIIGRQPVLGRSQHIIGYELMLCSKTLPMVREPDEVNITQIKALVWAEGLDQ